MKLQTLLPLLVQPPTQDKNDVDAMKTFSVFSIFGSAGLILLLNGCDPFGPRISHGPRITSAGNLHEIGMALIEYQSDHGVYPPELSSLVPKYITATNLQIFYVTNDSYRASELPNDWNVNPVRINQYSSYVYLGTNNPDGIVAYEKTNLWKPTVERPDQVAVLYSDGSVRSDIPISKLAGLIGAER